MIEDHEKNEYENPAKTIQKDVYYPFKKFDFIKKKYNHFVKIVNGKFSRPSKVDRHDFELVQKKWWRHTRWPYLVD